MNNLTPDTTYYVRAYATNSEGTAYGNEVSFITSQLPTYTIAVSANPNSGGSVSGGGTYQQGQSCTVNARASTSYTFTNWTENDSVVSTNVSYSFSVTANRTLVANFEQQITLPTVTTSQVTNITETAATSGGNVTADGGATVTARGICWSTSHNPTTSDSHGTSGSGLGSYTCLMTNLTPNTTYYVRAYATNSQGTAYGNEVNFTTTQLPTYTINVSANPTNGGSVRGGGTYQQGQSCTVSATAAAGYTFTNWTENGSVVSTNTSYTFTVTGNRTLVANFEQQAPQNYTITVSANPGNGGTVSGGGTYQQGQSCTVTAEANRSSSFYFDFDDSQMPAGWTTIDGGTPNGYGWRIASLLLPSTGYGHNGSTDCVLSQSYDNTYGAINPDNYLISPAVTLANSSTFSFWACAQDATYPAEHFGVAISTTGTNASDFTVINEWTLTAKCFNGSRAGYRGNRDQGAWYQYTVDLSDYAGEGRYIAIRHFNCMDQYCLVVDDIALTGNSSFTFVNWTENGNVVSTNASYTFTVNSNRNLVANFTQQAPQSYHISVSASPSNGGSVSGGGTYQQGQSCTVNATASTGYIFTNWTENGSQVSTNASYSFTVTANRTLMANFTYNGGGNAPTGAINGLFTVNANGDQVYFSQGNLQYKASTNIWRFAPNQWDYIGEDNANISSTYSGWIDLFGWGTSGYNHGAICYQPWSTSQTNSDYYAYGQETYNLYDQTDQADWGYNAISNGGNTIGQWHTLTGGFSDGEWKYIFNTRSASTVNGVANARYAKAKVANVQGVILFPDDYTHPSGLAQPVGINEEGDVGWNGNDYSASEFGLMEQQGAVFLPAAGCRLGTSVNIVGSTGYYWSASYYNSSEAFSVRFFSGYFSHWINARRYEGYSVRLVCPAQ